MSTTLLQKLKGFEHTFVGYIAKEYQAFRKEEPTLIALSDRAYPYIKSALQIAIGFESPAIAAAVGPLVDKIHSSFDTAVSLLYDFGANPTVASDFDTAIANLASFETAANITNTASKAAIAKALLNAQALAAAIKNSIDAVQPA